MIMILGMSSTGLRINGGPGSLSHDFKIWPITFQGSGPSGPFFLVVKNLTLIKIFTNSTKQKLHVGSQYSKTCLNKKWWLNEGRKDCRILQGEHSAILLTFILF